MISYKDAGVDIDTANQFVEAIKPMVAGTAVDGVLGGIGSFSGAFAMPAGYERPVLLGATDGVGTKLRLAIDSHKLDTIGIDLVAMCVNDLICNFARPLFFLDYYATGKLNLKRATSVVGGICEGCKQAGCALIGGETAEMPDMYGTGDFDIAGFAVGIAEQDEIDRRPHVRVGDALVALPSSGLHSNGFSLARRVIKAQNLKFNDKISGESLIDVLLRPTRIYVSDFLRLKPWIQALAHITGGGIVENLPRVLPEGLGAVVERAAIKRHEIFDIMARSVEQAEMDRTFNCGVGLVLVVRQSDVAEVLANSDGYVIGEIVRGDGVRYSG